MSAVLQDERRFAKDTVIFRQGDSGHEMFVISEGKVRLTIEAEGHEREVGVFGRGEFFGELSLLTGAERSATAVAVEDSVLLIIGRDVFAMMVQDDLDIVFSMLNIQGRRLTRTNEPIHELLQCLAHIRIAAHGLRQLRHTEAPALSLEIAQVAADLQLNPGVVEAAVSELVESGVGAVRDGKWKVRREDSGPLLDALYRYAETTAARNRGAVSAPPPPPSDPSAG